MLLAPIRSTTRETGAWGDKCCIFVFSVLALGTPSLYVSPACEVTAQYINITVAFVIYMGTEFLTSFTRKLTTISGNMMVKKSNASCPMHLSLKRPSLDGS